MSLPPILDNKHPDAPSVFEPAALLREARRQKSQAAIDVPPVCILDPDGDIVRRLKKSGIAKRIQDWPCHTDLYGFPLADQTAGIIACAVGAPFAVLVAEELFACGCQLLISLTSAGQIVPAASPPYFVVIDRALRDDGSSYHYAAPDAFAEADPHIVAIAMRALNNAGLRAHVGPAGRRTRPSVKQPQPSRRRVLREFWPSKWRLPPSTHSRVSETRRSFVSHTLPTQWGSPTRILRRVKRTERPTLDDP